MRCGQTSFLFKFSFNHNVDITSILILDIHWLIPNVLLNLHEVEELLNCSPFHSDKAGYTLQKVQQLIGASHLDFTQRSVKIAFVQYAKDTLCHTCDRSISSVVCIKQSQFTKSLTFIQDGNLKVIHSVVEIKIFIIDREVVIWHIVV